MQSSSSSISSVMFIHIYICSFRLQVLRYGRSRQTAGRNETNKTITRADLTILNYCYKAIFRLQHTLQKSKIPCKTYSENLFILLFLFSLRPCKISGHSQNLNATLWAMMVFQRLIRMGIRKWNVRSGKRYSRVSIRISFVTRFTEQE